MMLQPEVSESVSRTSAKVAEGDRFMTLQPGDRVVTPTGRSGVIQEPPWEMPLYHLVKLDSSSDLHWFRRDILSHLEAGQVAA